MKTDCCLTPKPSKIIEPNGCSLPFHSMVNNSPLNVMVRGNHIQRQNYVSSNAFVRKWDINFINKHPLPLSHLVTSPSSNVRLLHGAPLVRDHSIFAKINHSHDLFHTQIIKIGVLISTIDGGQYIVHFNIIGRFIYRDRNFDCYEHHLLAKLMLVDFCYF